MRSDGKGPVNGGGGCGGCGGGCGGGVTGLHIGMISVGGGGGNGGSISDVSYEVESSW